MPDLLALNQIEIILQLFLAALLGGIIGLEREFLKKAAGLRTYVMVSLGCTLFTIVSYKGFPQFIESTRFDPSRIASSVLVGMGFIGAGTILKQRNKIEGITTAAGLWVTAAIGLAVGLHFYLVAIFTALFTLVILVLFRRLEFWINQRTAKPKDIEERIMEKREKK